MNPNAENQSSSNSHLHSSTQKQEIVHIVGAGLAGSEAAYHLAENGIKVRLYEMRPNKMTEAHHTHGCAELVCSNSLKSTAAASAPGILKSEMRSLHSLILEAADASAVPGGESLSVDRAQFSDYVTKKLKSHPNIELITSTEIDSPFEDGITLFATGPLTSEPLARWIAKSTGESDLYFYDAIAPIIDATTIDYDNAYLGNRYGKGGPDAYLNCPLTKDEYYSFIGELTHAEQVPTKDFEKEKFFQGCQPIEAIAASGIETLRFGPMKPVGLPDPRTGQIAYAVVQLRPENLSATSYNMVGFQTKLKYGEQKRVFQKIPALRNAEFFRLGSVHRNTYLCGPQVLRPDLSLKKFPKVYFAGQITGVEGYLESSACGLLSALFISQRLRNEKHFAPPANTALGALLRHVTGSDPKNFQPDNIHFGLIDPQYFNELSGLKKDEARKKIAEQCLVNFECYLGEGDRNNSCIR